ncbi:MAG: electron transport complex subunit RsxB [Chromatiales bacterium]|jgi:electron transport complex protein RnfB|nr:electron transport complex subunit RsxB [Chromatiales bacterium]MDH4030614.1 electron transport complex subunit RsxB [Chromatiales bacterium]
MVAAIVAIATLSAGFGLLLGFAAVRFRTEGDPVVERIDALLPQTQCAQCGFPGCRPYAEAILAEGADINRCPPGGDATIKALADLLDREPKPLDPERGVEKPRAIAVIDEDVCIGCTLCIQACPVDAILGAGKLMHTVITEECTGCELCLPPCPVDCIDMIEEPATLLTWRWPRPAAGAGPSDNPSRQAG